MGWKSTIDITRKDAIRLVFMKMADVHNMSDRDLANLVETLGYGDDNNLPYYGHNFNVVEDNDVCDGCHQSGSEYCANSCNILKI